MAEDLYGLPPGEFTQARDALVKRLRADKERDLANQVKGLRRPTLAAWALNQLVRNRRRDVDKLLAAGEELQKAQEQLVGGGDRAGFQRAAAKERELVAQLARDASALAAEAGVGSQGLEEKLISTLHAAALDEETAAELAAGRVLRERQPVAGFGGARAGPGPSKPAAKRAKPAKPPKEGRREERSARPPRRRRRARSCRRRASRSARRAASGTPRRRRPRAQPSALAKAEERAAEAARRLDEAREELEEAEKDERAAGERHESAAACGRRGREEARLDHVRPQRAGTTSWGPLTHLGAAGLVLNRDADGAQRAKPRG